ncbi:hypothetical protein IIA28_10375 [candidate division KSB1 bacterium]|nr:hypothetical protein [candidate division KSB1 bacterium]
MKHLRLALIGAVALVLTTSVFAQRYKIIQRQTTYDRDILFSFSDQPGMQDDDKRAEFFLNISQAELNKMAQANGLSPKAEIVTIYVDAATGNFRTDTESADGKESAFYHKKTKEMCNVTWTTSEFFCMNMAKMGDYQKQAQDAMKNMPNLEKMLQNIPDPAAREKAMKALKEAQKGGMPAFPGQPAAVDNLKITKTGKTRRVDGDVQTQVRFTKGSESGIAWVSKKHMGLAKVAQAISEDMKKTFGDMAGDDIRGKIKDGFPVEIRTFEQNMMRGQASLVIEKVTKIEKGFSGNPFDFDRSKLTEKSPMSMGGSKTRKY